MTYIAVKEQIQDIQKATQQAQKSKESAMKFLVEAGILKTASQTGTVNKKKK